MNDFRDLFHEAVDHVEPNPGLDAIRSRLEEAPAMNRRWIAPLAGAAAVAAVVLGFVVIQGGDDREDTGGPLNTPSGSVSPSPTPTDDPRPTPDVTGTPPVKAAPVYRVGMTPFGPRLYREFFNLGCVGPDCFVHGAVEHGVEARPGDPDYRNPWPKGASVRDVTVRADLITVDLAPASLLHDKPAGWSDEDARIAVQQVIYTAQAAAGKGRLPIQLLLDGKHTDQVLGQPASEPLANDPITETLSLVNITTPGQDADVTGDTLKVTGVANSFEATVGLELRRYEGGEVVWRGSATASECCGDKLFPFSTSIDVSKVAPGRYLLWAATDDPSGGEGPGPFTDTKGIVIG